MPEHCPIIHHCQIKLWLLHFIYVFPAVLLHLQYYSRNQNDIFQYDKLSGRMIYRTGDSTLTFGQEEIKKITVFKSRPLSENRTSVLSWDDYNYAVIELKNGLAIKLSSLLVNELDKVVRFDNVEVKKTLYAWMV